MPKPVPVNGEGLTVDLLLFRAYGRPGNTDAMVRATYALNPGLADRGSILPLGVIVQLADLPKRSATRRPSIDLFSV